MSEAYIRRRQGAGAVLTKSAEIEDFITFAASSQVLAQDLELVSAQAVDIINFTSEEQTSSRLEVVATFNSNGGTAVASQSGLSPLSVQQPTSPTRTGYTFLGWRLNNQPVIFPAVITQNTTFIAAWQPRQYTVTLNKQSGTGGTNSVTATFDSPMPAATAPTREGFFFTGYFDASSGGTRYYNANMTSARNWDKPNNATLFARWIQATLRMRTFGFYSDNPNTILTIPNGVQVSVSLPQINFSSSPTLINSFTTISSSIPAGSSGGTFTAPQSIVRQSPTGANVTWNFTRWDISAGGQNYTWSNRTLNNPFDPSGIGVSINLFTTTLLSLTAVYSATRPTYQILLTTNKTSGTRNGLYQAPSDFFGGSNTYSVYPINGNITIQEGTNPSESSYSINAPWPDGNWNFDTFVYTTDSQGNPTPNGGFVQRVFGNIAKYMESDQFITNDRRNVESRFSQFAADVHPPITVTFSYNVNTKQLTIDYINSNMSQPTRNSNIRSQLHRSLNINGTLYPDIKGYDFNNESTFMSLAGGEKASERFPVPSNLTIENVNQGERVWLILEVFQQTGIVGPILRSKRTQTFIYTAPQFT